MRKIHRQKKIFTYLLLYIKISVLHETIKVSWIKEKVYSSKNVACLIFKDNVLIMQVFLKTIDKLIFISLLNIVYKLRTLQMKAFLTINFFFLQLVLLYISLYFISSSCIKTAGKISVIWDHFRQEISKKIWFPFGSI